MNETFSIQYLPVFSWVFDRKQFCFVLIECFLCLFHIIHDIDSKKYRVTRVIVNDFESENLYVVNFKTGKLYGQ